MKISIVTINLNNKEGLNRTILSVLNQDYVDIEYIVVDGASSDGSIGIIRKYENKIAYWVSEEDKGIYNAMNKGILKAHGEYVVMINSGDELYASNTISSLVKMSAGKDIVYGNLMNIDKYRRKEFAQNSIDSDSMSFKLWFLGYSIPHVGTMIKTSCFRKYGLYDESLKIVSDWKFFLLGKFKYGLSFLRGELFTGKFELGGLSSNEKNVQLMCKERELVIKTEFPLLYPDYSEIYSSGVKRASYLIRIQKYPVAKVIATIVLKIISYIRF